MRRTYKHCQRKFSVQSPKQRGGSKDVLIMIIRTATNVKDITVLCSLNFFRTENLELYICRKKLSVLCLCPSVTLWMSKTVAPRNLYNKAHCPKCSANPIRVTHIWKWEFENKKHPIRGLYMIFFEKFLFKYPFSHQRFQMGQKMYFYQLYKL